MSGWRIVPVEATKEQLRAVLLSPFGAAGRQYKAAVAAAPEPDWEALAGIVLNDDVYDQYATGGEIRRLAAALRATFGSKP